MTDAKDRYVSELDILKLIRVDLSDIYLILREMKEQEHQYWETWRKAKEAEKQ